MPLQRGTSCAAPTQAALPVAEIPRAPGFDNSLALLSEGYEFISRRCDRLDSNLFRTRLMLRPFVCMRGEDMARLFYDEERFIREGAAPLRVKQTLFGNGGVQGLDGAAHRDRKSGLRSQS